MFASRLESLQKLLEGVMKGDVASIVCFVVTSLVMLVIVYFRFFRNRSKAVAISELPQRERSTNVADRPSSQPTMASGQCSREFLQLIARQLPTAALWQRAWADHLGNHDYQLDMERGTVVFTQLRWFSRKKLELRFQLLGSQSAVSGTWLWAWANDSTDIPAPLLSTARKIRALGEKHHIPELTKPSFDGAIVDPLILAQVCAGLSHCVCCRANYQDGAQFFLVESAPAEVFVPAPLERILSILTEFAALNYVLDWRLVAQHVFRSQQLEVDNQSQAIVGRRGGSSITISLDDAGLPSGFSAHVAGDVVETTPAVTKAWRLAGLAGGGATLIGVATATTLLVRHWLAPPPADFKLAAAPQTQQPAERQSASPAPPVAVANSPPTPAAGQSVPAPSSPVPTAPPQPELTVPGWTLPPVAHDADTVEPLAIVGNGRAGEAFADEAPAGGALVGLVLAQGKSWGGAVEAVQPIYQVGDRYVRGQRYGNPGGTETIVLARQGYLVDGLNARAGLALNAVQLLFAAHESLETEEDSYASEWVGVPGGSPTQTLAEGRPVVGIHGRQVPQSLGLGLLAARDEPGGAAAEEDEAAIPERLPPLAYAQRSIKSSPVLGRSDGEAFSEHAPDGGALVGLVLWQGTAWGGAVQAVQPIYQVGDAQMPGTRFGAPGGKESKLVARRGYVVGGLNVRAGLAMNAVQLVFVRCGPDRIYGGNSYESDWVGVPGGQAAQASAGRRLVVGIHGTAQSELLGLGISSVAVRIPADTP